MRQFQGSLGPIQELQPKGQPRPPTLQKNGSFSRYTPFAPRGLQGPCHLGRSLTSRRRLTLGARIGLWSFGGIVALFALAWAVTP